MARKRQITGRAALEAAFDAKNHGALFDAWGVSIPTGLLCHALTHRSFANEVSDEEALIPNNERLEFMGDAVLGLIVAEKLYEEFPHRSESDLSKMRANIVSTIALAEVAREIGLGSYVLLGKGETLTGGADKDSILADTMEALIAATFLTYGYTTTKSVLLTILTPRIMSVTADSFITDWKTALLEHLSGLEYSVPRYEVRAEGPLHDQTFYATVSLDAVVYGEGQGHNKKEAEHNAAKAAVRRLSEEMDATSSRGIHAHSSSEN